MSTITKKQIALIKMAQKQLGISDDEYRALLNERYWRNSCTKLSYEEATALIDYLKFRGFKIKKKRARRQQAPNLIYAVSPQQLHELERLKADVNWRHQNGFLGLVKKVIKKEKIITGLDASKMIEALKGIIRRQNAAFEGRINELA